MKNITELRDELANVFSSLKKDELEVKTAKEMNNAAGKMINTLKVELDYNTLQKNGKKISFLETK